MLKFLVEKMREAFAPKQKLFSSSTKNIGEFQILTFEILTKCKLMMLFILNNQALKSVSTNPFFSSQKLFWRSRHDRWVNTIQKCNVAWHQGSCPFLAQTKDSAIWCVKQSTEHEH